MASLKPVNINEELPHDLEVADSGNGATFPNPQPPIASITADVQNILVQEEEIAGPSNRNSRRASI